jgi:hypothetical protein
MGAEDICKNPPLVPLMSQMNPVHGVFFYIYFGYFRLLLCVSSDLFHLDFPTKIVCFIYSDCNLDDRLFGEIVT